MENKYFTPEISDLHVGYECEIYENGKYVSYVIPHIIVGGNTRIDIPDGRHWSVENKLRTLHLNKEQIENEGWKHSEKNCFDFNDRWMCSWYPEHNRIEFYDNENENGFAGNCKDINTFRKIIKLLEI